MQAMSESGILPSASSICARFGLPCTIFMGATDVARQQPNVFRMKLLGAEVVPVKSGTRTLKDAMNEALRDWVANVENTFYIIGTVAGPHPYPTLVRDFQSIIGQEVRWQMEEAEGRLPDSLVACIGGGSNAMGLFHPFLDDASVEIYGVEAGGDGVETGRHAASLTGGRPGVLHGNRTYLLQNEDGQINDAHSISSANVGSALAALLTVSTSRISGIRVSATKRPPNMPKRPNSSGPLR